MTGKRVLAHRLLAEQQLGRPLRPREVVHHRDGNSLNNDPANLIVLPSQRYHAHAEFHDRRRRSGMPSLFPEYFQGVPESRGGLFDHVFVVVMQEPPLPIRRAQKSREGRLPEAESLFPQLAREPVSLSRNFTLALPPEFRAGPHLLGELLGQLAVKVEQGDQTESATLSDFFSNKTE